MNIPRQHANDSQPPASSASISGEVALDSPAAAGFLFPLYFPFHIQGAWKRLWWVSLLMFVPIVNALLLRGWRLELASRIARGDQDILPPARGLLKYLFQGLVLWTMTFMYTLVPLTVIMILGIGGIIDTIADIKTFLQIIVGQSDMTLTQFIVNEVWEEIACLLIAGIWAMISVPLYRAGMVRYCVTGRITSFANVVANTRFISANAGEFLSMYTFGAAAWFLLCLLASFLTSTGFGLLIVILILPPLHYWSSGYEFGRLGRTLYRDLYGETIEATIVTSPCHHTATQSFAGNPFAEGVYDASLVRPSRIV